VQITAGDDAHQATLSGIDLRKQAEKHNTITPPVNMRIEPKVMRRDACAGRGKKPQELLVYQTSDIAEIWATAPNGR